MMTDPNGCEVRFANDWSAAKLFPIIRQSLPENLRAGVSLQKGEDGVNRMQMASVPNATGDYAQWQNVVGMEGKGVSLMAPSGDDTVFPCGPNNPTINDKASGGYWGLAEVPTIILNNPAPANYSEALALGDKLSLADVPAENRTRNMIRCLVMTQTPSNPGPNPTIADTLDTIKHEVFKHAVPYLEGKPYSHQKDEKMEITQIKIEKVERK